MAPGSWPSLPSPDMLVGLGLVASAWELSAPHSRGTWDTDMGHTDSLLLARPGLRESGRACPLDVAKEKLTALSLGFRNHAV